MSKLTTLIVALIVAAVLGFNMFSYQVRYDEVAVRTTFGSAGADSLKTEPGLYGKAPWPFQKVTRYKKQLYVLEAQLQEFQTADHKSVIAKAYLIWKISDPLAFFQSLENIPAAQDQLLTQLNSQASVFGDFDFSDLVNLDPSRIKLDEIETRYAQDIRSQIASSNYGIEIMAVGIRRLILPEPITQTVFDRMKSDRNARAEKALAEGEATAALIRTEAETKRKTIMAFADRRAQEIEARGAQEAARVYSTFQADESFAAFLLEIETLKEALGHNTKFFFQTRDLELMRLFKDGPQVVTDPKTGKAAIVPKGSKADAADGGGR